MKRILSLLVLLGFVAGGLLTGCNQNDTSKPATPATNAQPSTPSAPTNK